MQASIRLIAACMYAERCYGFICTYREKEEARERKEEEAEASNHGVDMSKGTLTGEQMARVMGQQSAAKITQLFVSVWTDEGTKQAPA